MPENGGTPAVPAGPPVPYYSSAPKPVEAEPFDADFKDVVFAVFAYILGYFFCRWVLAATQGWGIAAFTAVYLASTLLYFIKKGVRPVAASWFWFAVTLLTGLSFALWADIGLGPLRSLFLFCSSVYWVLSAASVQVAGKTGNLLFLDGLNALFVIPFSNFLNQYKAFAWLRGERQRDAKKGLRRFPRRDPRAYRPPHSDAAAAGGRQRRVCRPDRRFSGAVPVRLGKDRRISIVLLSRRPISGVSVRARFRRGREAKDE